MRPQALTENRHHQRLLGAAALWLLAGSFLLITTLIPVYTDLLGWTPVFWLVVAPLIVLLTLEPSLPRQLLKLRLPRRQTQGVVMWH
jgi:hypothetical protein